MEGLEGNEVEKIRKCLPNLSFDIVRAIYTSISDDEIGLYHFQVQILKKINLVIEGNPSYRDHLNHPLEIIRERVMEPSHNISPQMIDDITCELQRVCILSAYWELCKKINYYKRPELLTIQMKLDDLMAPTTKFDQKREAAAKKLLRESEKFVGGLGISNEERVSILGAMGLKQGHWYKCRNDHIYCIADCGGAMEEAKCPECGEIIGGSNHALRSDNNVATEMDGAVHAAWSEHYNDMNNFNFED